MSVQEIPPSSAAPRRAAFDADDLRYLQNLLHEILADLRERNSLATHSEGCDEMKVRLAAALFDCAKPGMRDDLRLKRLAVENVASSRFGLR